MSYKSLNEGDVFVLDDGKVIYCWNGKDSSKRERVKVMQMFSLFLMQINWRGFLIILTYLIVFAIWISLL